jgi:ABC-type transporter Mla subunit MlaD
MTWPVSFLIVGLVACGVALLWALLRETRP